MPFFILFIIFKIYLCFRPEEDLCLSRDANTKQSTEKVLAVLCLRLKLRRMYVCTYVRMYVYGTVCTRDTRGGGHERVISNAGR
jgi:hypothetical protein